MATAAAISSDDWDVFEVPDPYRAEVLLGELVVSPAPSREHIRAQVRLFETIRPRLPGGLEAMLGPGWRVDEGGRIVHAAEPDLSVLQASPQLTDTPLLAVEVLSPFDADPLTGHRIPRIEARRMAYALFGLRHYLEVDLAGEPALIRYELQDGELSEVDRVTGAQVLAAGRPFTYQLAPDDLVR